MVGIDILFRAKRKDNGKWVYGVPVATNWNKTITYFWLENSSDPRSMALGYPKCEIVEVIPETIGQYLGTCGDEKVRIFEGDVVDASWGYRGNVYFTEFIYAKMQCTISSDIRVIGNKYDNPGLHDYLLWHDSMQT